MMLIGSGVLCALIGIFTLVAGIQLCRGKWYRIIAGNSQADPKTIEEQKKSGLGRGVGIILFIATFMLFFYAWLIFSQW